MASKRREVMCTVTVVATHLLFLLIIAGDLVDARHPPPAQQEQRSRGADETSLIHTWAEAARSWFIASVATAEAGLSSRDPENVALAFGLFSAEVAREISRLSRTAIRVYAAVAAEGETLTATLPDGPMARAGSHHGVLLLDPFPAARFGHPVLMFFVDLGISERRCTSLGGKRLGEYKIYDFNS
jgi:hypothetical protein